MQGPLQLDVADEAVELADLVVYPAHCRAVKRNRVIRLGEKECRILVMLLRANGRVVSIPDLLGATCGEDSPAGAARVRGVVPRLRAKLRTPNLILTIGGEGYCVEHPRPTSSKGNNSIP